MWCGHLEKKKVLTFRDTAWSLYWSSAGWPGVCSDDPVGTNMGIWLKWDEYRLIVTEEGDELFPLLLDKLPHSHNLKIACSCTLLDHCEHFTRWWDLVSCSRRRVPAWKALLPKVSFKMCTGKLLAVFFPENKLNAKQQRDVKMSKRWKIIYAVTGIL